MPCFFCFSFYSIYSAAGRGGVSSIAAALAPFSSAVATFATVGTAIGFFSAVTFLSVYTYNPFNAASRSCSAVITLTLIAP